MKYAMLIPYFGTWPLWFKLYLYSASKNKCIDFIFLTDCTIPKRQYDNVYFIKYSWDEYCRLVSNKLNISFTSKLSAYKLCDLKPFYGIIHEDLLMKYDYWGYGDIDLVYGNLSVLLQKAEGQDIISTHGDRLSGHFCMIKNGQLNYCCFSIPKWKERLESSKHFGLDENDFSNVMFPILRLLKSIRYRLKIKSSLNNDVLWKVLKVLFYHKAYLKEIPTSPKPKDGDFWLYHDGDVEDQNSNHLPYLHFLFFKKTCYWKENIHYWRNGYYKLDDNEDFGKETIKITNKEISKI